MAGKKMDFIVEGGRNKFDDQGRLAHSLTVERRKARTLDAARDLARDFLVRPDINVAHISQIVPDVISGTRVASVESLGATVD